MTAVAAVMAHSRRTHPFQEPLKTQKAFCSSISATK